MTKSRREISELEERREFTLREMNKIKIEIKNLEDEKSSLEILKARLEQISKSKEKIEHLKKQIEPLKKDVELLSEHITNLKEKILRESSVDYQFKKKAHLNYNRIINSNKAMSVCDAILNKVDAKTD